VQGKRITEFNRPGFAPRNRIMPLYPESAINKHGIHPLPASDGTEMTQRATCVEQFRPYAVNQKGA
jgi:hypothetical protein